MPNYVIGIELDAKDNASKQLGDTAKATENLDASMGKGKTGAGALGGALAGLVSPAGLATGALAALGAAAVATGAQAVALAGEVEGSTAKLTAQLNLSAEEAGEFEETMRSIYRNNYGESFEDIGAALSEVEMNFRRIGGTESQQQLQQVTELALKMRDAFDLGVNESTSAAATLMDNFGLSAQEAFDFLVAGQQRGLNASDDFLDTIGEYSNQFAAAGATADEFFSILETGIQGGVLGTDKIADAVKEFNIRLVDDSETTKTALAEIGISYDELTQGLADGSITQIEAMQMVIEKINEIEDPVQRNIIGVALFGTQWEDLTADVILGVDTQKTKLSELEGAADSLEEQYNTAGKSWQSVTRQWEDALVDVGAEMRSLGVEVIPYVAQAVNDYVVPAIQTLTKFVQLIQMGASFSWQTWMAAGIIGAAEQTGQVPFMNLPESPAPPPPMRSDRSPLDVTLRSGQPDLAVVNPLNRVPVTEPSNPLDSVPVTWDDQTGRAVTINQNFYGPANPEDTERATVEAARRMGMR